MEQSYRYQIYVQMNYSQTLKIGYLTNSAKMHEFFAVWDAKHHCQIDPVQRVTTHVTVNYLAFSVD